MRSVCQHNRSLSSICRQSLGSNGASKAAEALKAAVHLMVMFSSAQWGIKMDGFQLLNFETGHFGTRLGVSLAAPKGVSKRMGFKIAIF